MKAKNQNSFSSKYWLIIILTICVILLVLSYVAERSESRGARGPLSVAADYTIVPMQKGLNKIGMWMSDFTKNFATMQEILKENVKLKEENDNLVIENNQLQQKAVELDRFYELYKMDEQTADYEKVGARVIASDTSNWFSTFTIDKGSNDGMRVDMNVMSGKGLVGIITQVGPTSSTVRTIIDDSSNIRAMMLTTFDKCTVTGNLELINTGCISFSQLSNNGNQIPVGEQVVTSNISNKYLQGLLIGHVKEVVVDSNNLTRSGYIIPAVDFRELQEVLVITTTKQDVIDKKGTADQSEDEGQDDGTAREDGSEAAGIAGNDGTPAEGEGDE